MEITATAEFAAPIELVRDQSNDIDHHIAQNIHKRLNLNSLKKNGKELEYYQEIRLLGFVFRDKIVHKTLDDGSISLSYSGGISNGAKLVIKLKSIDESRTLVHQTFTAPLTGLKRLFGPLIEFILKKELYKAFNEDRVDIEERGYPR